MFPNLLKDSVWHTTSVERFNGIILTGSILPEPPIDDSGRWGTACGKEMYPYVRRLGGVSLFDFTGFDEVKYGKMFPVSNWSAFVPCCSKWDESIWIKINTNAIQESFIDGVALLNRWKKEGSYQNRIMPRIESAHIGPLPSSAFLDVFKYSGGKWQKLNGSSYVR